MSGTTLVLEPRLDLRASSALAKTILEHKGRDLVLDARQVNHVGALAVQAIRAAARTWKDDGRSLRFEHASTELVDQLVLLGFTPESLVQWEQPQ